MRSSRSACTSTGTTRSRKPTGATSGSPKGSSSCASDRRPIVGRSLPEPRRACRARMRHAVRSSFFSFFDFARREEAEAPFFHAVFDFRPFFLGLVPIRRLARFVAHLRCFRHHRHRNGRGGHHSSDCRTLRRVRTRCGLDRERLRARRFRVLAVSSRRDVGRRPPQGDARHVDALHALKRRGAPLDVLWRSACRPKIPPAASPGSLRASPRAWFWGYPGRAS